MTGLFAIAEYDPSLLAQFNLFQAQPPDSLRIDPMLFSQHTSRQRLYGVVTQHRYGGLDDDRAVIEIGRDEMYRAAMYFNPVAQRASMSFQTAICWQQRRVDIDHFSVIMRHEVRREDTHEARKCDEIGMKIVYCSDKLRVEAVSIRIVAMFDDGGGDVMSLRDVQPFRIRAIADYRRNLAWQFCFQQGLQVAATARDQNDDIFHRVSKQKS